MPEMEEGALVIDDIYHFEMERLLEIYKPDVFCAGSKRSTPSRRPAFPASSFTATTTARRMAGFRGAINFYREIDRMVNTKIWSYVQAPWETEEELGGIGDRKLARRLWRETAMLLRHTTAEVKERSALTINPAKTCQPIGGYVRPPWGYTTVCHIATGRRDAAPIIEAR